MSKRVVLTILSMLLPVLGHAGLSVQFTLSPAHTLPALPVSFHVTVTNSDPVARPLPPGAILIMTPAAGEPAFALAYNSSIAENIAGWTEGVTSVGPHSQYTFDIPVDGTLGNPSWFYDARLNRPGDYRLQLVLSDLPGEKLRNIKPTALASVLTPNSVVSNEAMLTVDTPVGEDAAVWQLIQGETHQRAGAGIWLNSGDLMRRIWTAHRASTYAQYIALRVPLDSVEQQIKAIQDVLAASPNGPLADWQQLQIGELEHHLYGDAHGHGRDAAILAQHAQRAVAAYRAVIKTAHSTKARSVAQQKLDDILDELGDDGIDVK